MWKLLVFLLIGQLLAAEIKPFEPEQVHIAFGESARDIVITWTTLNETESSVVYGIKQLILQQKGELQILKKNSTYNVYMHRATLPHLTPNTRYIYRCGSDKGWSKQFNFHVPAIDNDWAPSVAIYGDLGFGGPHGGITYPLLENDTQKQMYDAVLHIGDIVYSIHNVGQATRFFRKIEPTAAYVPYMTCAGNHEEHKNFTHYRKRFNMPGDTEGLYYSFDLGPVHFIMLHTEFYYYLNRHYDARHVLYQYQWLERDLQEATKPENRAKRPWIIALGHRPMYCSVNNTNDCRPEFVSLLRGGIPVLNIYGLEDILYRNGVDVEIWGHQHSYERSWPLYDNKVFNGSLEEPYRNPKAPVHITSGAAGCFYGPDKFCEPIPEWVAFQDRGWSFTRMKAYNATHLYFEQVSAVNKIKDSFWIVKDKHGSYV